MQQELVKANSIDLVEQRHRAAPTREQVERFQAILAQAEQTDLRTRHFLVLGPGGLHLYARQITIPARTYLSGAAHKRAHLVSCSGDIEVTTDDGVKRLTGCHTFIGQPGHKRAGSAHVETVWTTYHVVTADTIEEIENEISEEAHLLQTRNLALGMESPALVEA